MTHGLYICLFLASLGGLAITLARLPKYLIGAQERRETRRMWRELKNCQIADAEEYQDLMDLMRRANYR